MEARIAKIESDVEYIKDVMDDIKLDVRATQGELKAANDSITELKGEVGAIKATLPHLATKAELKTVEGSLNARINQVEGSLSAAIHAAESRIIKWIIFTGIGAAGLAVSLAVAIDRVLHQLAARI